MGLAAPTLLSEDGPPTLSGQVRASCSGTMMAIGLPPSGSHVMANGVVDFAGRRVQGFGVSSQPIVVLTASEIDFGSAPPAGARYGSVVDGAIDRKTGQTHIVVRSVREPGDIRLEMLLDCEFERPVSWP